MLKKMGNGIKNRYKVGERVFAKIRGHPYWPAVVTSVDTSNKIVKYNVNFYGTGEIGCVKEIDICSFIENKTKHGGLKVKNKHFSNAMKEAENSLNNSCSNINRSVQSPSIYSIAESNISSPQVTPSDFSSSVLENNTSSPQEISSILSSNSHSLCRINKYMTPTQETCMRERNTKDVSVNTSTDLDLNFQLHALTEKCIALEMSLVEDKNLTLKLQDENLGQTIEPNVQPPSNMGTQTDAHICPKITNANTQTEVTAHNLLLVTDELLNEKWLTDLTIQPYFQMLNDRFLEEKSGIIINPLLVHAIKNTDDFASLLEPLSIIEKNFVILPINDSVSLSDFDSGSHWSTLVYTKSENKYLYFDSCGTYNKASALKVAKQLSFYLNKTMPVEFVELGGPQQENNRDCAIFMCWTVESVVYDIISASNSVDTNFLQNATLTQSDIVTKRSLLCYTLFNLTKLTNETIISLMIVKHGKRQNNEAKPSQSKEVMKSSTNLNDKANFRTNYSFTNNQHNRNWTLVKRKPNSRTKPLLNQNTFNNKPNIDLSNYYGTLGKVNNDITSLSEEDILTNRKTACSKKDKVKQTNKTEYPKTKITVCSDSQGKHLAPKITELSQGRVDAFGYVRPNTTLIQVTDSAKIDTNNPLVLLGGTNDSFDGNFKNIYKNLENKLKDLSETRPIFLCTVPTRYDKKEDSQENDQIQMLNNYIGELAARIDGVFLIDLGHLNRHHFTVHGLHLNIFGTTKLARIILKSLTRWKIQELNHRYKSTQFPINVIEENMKDKILECKNQPKTAFSHCISGDFGAVKQMSAGVAVAFRDAFGKPQFSNRITKHLAYQQVDGGAGVYALITKDKYHSKPTLADYNSAFDDLIQDFNKRGFTRLVCSAMGCFQDRIPIDIFVTNIVKFYHLTGAPVDIVSLNQGSSTTLWSGLTQDEFITSLKYCVLSRILEEAQLPSLFKSLEPGMSSHLQDASANIPFGSLEKQATNEEPANHLEPEPVQILEVVLSESVDNNYGQSSVSDLCISLEDLN